MFQERGTCAQELVFIILRLAKQRSYTKKWRWWHFQKLPRIFRPSTITWVISQHEVLTLEEAKDKVKGQFVIPPDELIAARQSSHGAFTQSEDSISKYWCNSGLTGIHQYPSSIPSSSLWWLWFFIWCFVWFYRDGNGILLGYRLMYPLVMTKIAMENCH